MTELERALLDLAAEIDWPATPRVDVTVLGRGRDRRVPRLVAALALVAIALAVAFAVPQARSALLRIFHLGGVTVRRVETLPPARERPLDAGLGPRVSLAQAQRTLGAPFRLPTKRGGVQLHERDGVVSAMVAVPEPLLVSAFRSGGGVSILKKAVGGATVVEPAQVASAGDALWIEGARHLFLFPPAAPRLAGNVLLWEHRGITFRLEGPKLGKAEALALARRMTP